MIETGQHSPVRLRKAIRELAWHTIPPLAYFVLMTRAYPHWGATWLYFDEGFNLIKAMLVLRGYHLYSQIWSDQPPLFTHLLAGLFRLSGMGVYAPRILVLLFTCLLIWAVVQYLRLAWGNLPAALAAGFVCLLPQFIPLSASVMVGQPSLALAAASMLTLGAWHRRRHPALLALSAFALSASLLTKLFTAFLAPIFVSGLLLSEFYTSHGSRSWRNVLRPALFWSLAFAGFTAGVGLLLAGPNSIQQLVLPHLAASQAAGELPTAQANTITAHLRASWALLLLALTGAAYALKGRRWLMLYPIAWMALAALILLNIQPVWFHHHLLVTLPAAMLAAGAAGETLRIAAEEQGAPVSLRRSWLRVVVGGVLTVLTLATLLPQAVSAFQAPPADSQAERNPLEDKILRKIDQYAAQTNWIVTDIPMLAFRAGIPTPPELAVISWKRFASGELTEGDILDSVQSYQPEQVLIGRFDLPGLDPYLREYYTAILEKDGETRLYIRNDLLK